MPPWIDEPSELLTWLSILSIFAGALAWFGKKYTRWLRDLIREEISSHTSLIQPGSNGGKSLPDIARKVDRLIEHLGIEDDY
jgi:hypothetical protein